MTFVAKSLLFGIGFVALPIVLHLIMRQKPKLLEFPPLRFIQKRHDTNRRHLMLRHILLLLLRAGAIALLASALAQPSVKLSGVLGSREAPVAAALVFDAAPRMEYRHENRSRLEVAQELGLWLTSQLPRQSQIAVLDTRLGPAALQDDSGLVRQQIERLLAVTNSRPLADAVEEGLRLLGNSDLDRKELYIFTDFSQAGWPRDSATPLQELLKRKELRQAGIYLIDVGVEEPTNCALGELRLSGQVLSNRSSLRIETELSPTGLTGRRTVELHLLDDQRKPQKRSQQSYALDSGEPQHVQFRIGSLGVGTHQGLVRIVGQDGLAGDDVRFFTVEVKPAWRILVCAPKPARRYALYLTEALAPEVYRKRGQARFDCLIVELEELAQRPLEDYAAVCLLDPTPLEPAVWKKLQEFASDGHGVAIFLGRNAERVDSFNAPHAQQLLPGKLLRQVRAPDGDVYLSPRDYQHPILSAFRPTAGAVPWSGFPVFRFWQFESLHDGVNAVLPYNDAYRRPALLERPVATGRVLTMTTPVSDRPDEKAWNLLPVGEAWPFLILANQMACYLVGSSEQRLNYVAGEPAGLTLDLQNRRRTYLLTSPDELKLKVKADLTRHVLEVGSTEQVGNYRVQAGGGTEVDRGFSVNLAAKQTQLDRIGDEELAQLFGPFPYRVARTRDEIERDVSTGRVGRELFPLMILLVALALGLEYLVANRFYRQ